MSKGLDGVAVTLKYRAVLDIFGNISHDSSMLSAVAPDPVFLVIQLARFGDLIQTKRLILSLQRQGRVVLLVEHSLAAIARLIYPNATVFGVCAHGHHADVLGGTFQSLAELAPISFERVYNLNLSGLNFALAGMFPWERVRGYRMRAGQHLVDTWPDQLMRWVRRRVSAGLNLVDAWGLYAEQPVPPSEINPVAVPHGGGLGVVLAGQNARRSLPASVLAPLVQAARGRAGHGPIYLLGTAGENRAARELTLALPTSMRGLVRDMTGQTGWRELIDIVQGLDLLLSPDTGTMHLAAHLGVPVLAFFLSSAWCHETGPYGLGHTVIQSQLDCGPCLEREPCPHDVRCRHVFADPRVLRHVGGGANKPVPPECAVMESGFDDLGLIWLSVAGCDPHAADRTVFRSWAGACAGLPVPGTAAGAIDDFWVRERDWMLPQTLRGRVHE